MKAHKQLLEMLALLAVANIRLQMNSGGCDDECDEYEESDFLEGGCLPDTPGTNNCAWYTNYCGIDWDNFPKKGRGEEAMLIAADIPLKPGYSWSILQFDNADTSLVSEEDETGLWTTDFAVNIKGRSAARKAAIKKLPKDLILIVEECNGERNILGGPNDKVTLSKGYNSGTKEGDTKAQYSFAFQVSKADCEPCSYTGALLLD